MKKKYIPINSEFIRANTSDFEIFEHYVSRFYPNKKIELNKLVISPFKTSTQIPTFCICFNESSKKLNFIETSLNFEGDAVTMVMKLFNIELPTALRRIYKDLKLKTYR
jgi:hypothetical protein